MTNLQCWSHINQMSDNTHIDGLVTEVFDVLWTHVEGGFTGHDECLRPSKTQGTINIPVELINDVNTEMACK